MSHISIVKSYTLYNIIYFVAVDECLFIFNYYMFQSETFFDVKQSFKNFLPTFWQASLYTTLQKSLAKECSEKTSR